MPRTYQRKTNRPPNKSTKPKAIGDRFEPGFMAQLDQRTELCRVLRERFDSIANDLGGVQELSVIKSSLLERFLWLESMLARIESDMAKTTDPKATAGFLGPWIQGINSLLGISKTLGIERQAKAVDLKSYIAANGKDDQEAKLPPKVIDTNGHDLEDK